MKARYPDICARCRKPIRIGQTVVRPYGYPKWHTACYGKYATERNIPMGKRLAVR